MANNLQKFILEQSILYFCSTIELVKYNDHGNGNG